MDLYTRARKHIDMSRVKEIHTKNIEEQKIAKIKFQEEKILLEKKKIEILEDPRYSNWKSELVEGTPVPIEESMTTASFMSTTLPAEPDIIQDSLPSTSITSADNTGDPTENGIVPRVQSFQVTDSSKTDTITVTISGSFNTKTVDGSVINDKISIGVLVGGTYVGNYLKHGLGNGTHTVSIPPRFQKAGVKFDAIQVTAFQGGSGAQSGTVNITGVGLKRVNPMNVFVSLDDPEANAFIRDTLSNQNLSPEQKKKKLEEMLGASAEYLTKMFGEGIFTGASEISDVELQQSFADMANLAQLSPRTEQQIDDMLLKGLLRGDYGRGPDIERQIRNLKRNQQNNTPGGMQVQGNTGSLVAHHEPEGEVIVEKKLKSPESLLDKIPGYYDGKPAPLGFPIEEPPKMVNGKHPDLVDGKKVSKRYNRLDPTSAKAMPKTGNKHIDSKVAKARSKAK